MGIEIINAINRLEEEVKKLGNQLNQLSYLYYNTHADNLNFKNKDFENLKKQVQEIKTQLNNHIQTPDNLAHKGII